MKNRQPSLMVHTNPEFETSNLILDFEFDQHLESHKHVINIIMGFRDMGCYNMCLKYIGYFLLTCITMPTNISFGASNFLNS
jgi:hypothetical protein